MSKYWKEDYKEKMEGFLMSFNAYEINEYFATDFASDYDVFEKDPNNKEALSYLNDSFYDIDVDFSETDEFDTIVKKTLNKAIDMIK